MNGTIFIWLERDGAAGVAGGRHGDAASSYSPGEVVHGALYSNIVALGPFSDDKNNNNHLSLCLTGQETSVVRYTTQKRVRGGQDSKTIVLFARDSRSVVSQQPVSLSTVTALAEKVDWPTAVQEAEYKLFFSLELPHHLFPTTDISSMGAAWQIRGSLGDGEPGRCTIEFALVGKCQGSDFDRKVTIVPMATMRNHVEPITTDPLIHNMALLNMCGSRGKVLLAAKLSDTKLTPGDDDNTTLHVQASLRNNSQLSPIGMKASLIQKATWTAQGHENRSRRVLAECNLTAGRGDWGFRQEHTNVSKVPRRRAESERIEAQQVASRVDQSPYGGTLTIPSSTNNNVLYSLRSNLVTVHHYVKISVSMHRDGCLARYLMKDPTLKIPVVMARTIVTTTATTTANEQTVVNAEIIK